MTTSVPAAAITATMTVNDVLARHPGTALVLNVHGIDTCCGGHTALKDAAAEARAPLEPLLAALEAQVRGDSMVEGAR